MQMAELQSIMKPTPTNLGKIQIFGDTEQSKFLLLVNSNLLLENRLISNLTQQLLYNIKQVVSGLEKNMR